MIGLGTDLNTEKRQCLNWRHYLQSKFVKNYNFVSDNHKIIKRSLKCKIPALTHRYQQKAMLAVQILELHHTDFLVVIKRLLHCALFFQNLDRPGHKLERDQTTPFLF